MARPPNTALRETLTLDVLKTRTENPLMPSEDLHREVAARHNISLSCLRYYLRNSAATDARYKYSPAERHLLASMTRKELQAYAARHKINFSTIYAMVWRHRASSEASLGKIADHAAALALRNYMDFSRAKDLQAMGLPREAFKEAQKVIRAVQSLDLAAPNYIIHRPSCKFYNLSLSEQTTLLQNPRMFLKNRAQHISQNWSKYHPEGHYFLLLDPRWSSAGSVGRTISTHDTFEAGAQAQAKYLIAHPDSPCELREHHGDSRSPFVRYQPGDLVKRPETVSPDTRYVIRGDQDITEDNLYPPGYVPPQVRPGAPTPLVEDDDPEDCYGMPDDEA
jgi:hypothetical protein